MAETAASGIADDEAAQFAALRGAQFIRLTTFRRSGAGVPTQVWFAQVGDTLYITTMPEAGKVKRIRNNPRTLVAPCDARGVATSADVEARARVLPPAEAAQAREALLAKYGFRYTLIRLLGRVVRRRESDRAFLAVTPAA